MPRPQCAPALCGRQFSTGSGPWSGKRARCGVERRRTAAGRAGVPAHRAGPGPRRAAPAQRSPARPESRTAFH
ncbi:MAG: hypothetical protein GC145_08650 [Caulobacter sp.]|nr:hypothetical protein [Caulobacter sp.]